MNRLYEILGLKKVTVVFWDVQHGNAVYIRTPNNRHIVIDLGVGSYGKNNLTFSPLLHLKNEWKVNKLDCVIITHPHLDHIDDILNLYKLYLYKLSLKTLLRPESIPEEVIMHLMKNAQPKDKQKFEKYLEFEKYIEIGIINTYCHPVEWMDDIRNPNNNGGVEFKTFSSANCSTSNVNNHSIITVLSFAGRKIVFTGDNESCSFKELMEKPDFNSAIKNADILLAPHHGRESGFYKDFVDCVNPRLTVISDGRFRDTSATDRYSSKSKGMRVKRRNGDMEERKCVTTRNDGVITVEIDTKGELSVKIGKTQ